MEYLSDHINNTAPERFFWRVCALLATGNLLIGLGMLFGAPTISPSYDVAKHLLTIPTWGAIATAAGLLFFAGMQWHHRGLMLIGLSAGGFYTTLFGLTFGFAAMAGTLHGFTAVIWWMVVGTIHTACAVSLPSTKQIKRLKHHAYRIGSNI
jgi:hypothetical protein